MTSDDNSRKRSLEKAAGNAPYMVWHAKSAGVPGKTQPVDVSDKTQPVNVSDKTQPVNVSDKTQPVDVSDKTQPVNASDCAQSVKKSVGQLDDQSVGQLDDQSVGRLDNQSIGQLDDQSVGQLDNQSVGQLDGHEIGQSAAMTKDDPPQKAGVSAEVYEWVESFMSVLLPMVLIMVFLFRPATVFGQSMEPTLHNNDRLFLQVAGYNDPKYGDIVVVDRSWNGGETVIKRVIGKAGDVMFIDFDKHEVWRNDEKLDEPYINEPTAEWGDVEFPVQVPEGAVFVMGDNRNHSMDSRTNEIGMVDTRRVLGKVALRFFPFNKFGGVT